jgi:hypothetical protein
MISCRRVKYYFHERLLIYRRETCRGTSKDASTDQKQKKEEKNKDVTSGTNNMQYDHHSKRSASGIKAPKTPTKNQ